MHPYFLSHLINVLTNSAIGRVLHNPKNLGRLIKWTTELSEYDIQYCLCTIIKTQVLADFLAELMGEAKDEVWKVSLMTFQ